MSWSFLVVFTFFSIRLHASSKGIINCFKLISKISKKDPEPILKGGKKAKAKGTIEKKNVSYYEIPVSYEINGNFLNYVKFKRDIAKSKKLLNFNKEEINIEKNSNGNIIAKGELTIVGLPNEFN